MFLALSLSDIVFIMQINVEMPTIVGILAFMSKIHFMLSWVEHEKSVLTSDHIALHKLSVWYIVTVSVLWLFLAAPWVGMQRLLVVFPGYIHVLFMVKELKKWGKMIGMYSS